MVDKIVAENISKVFKIRNNKRKNGNAGAAVPDLVALQDISLNVQQGEFIVIVGPSGCGKSTFLDILAGLTEPSSGNIYIDGKAVHGPALDRGMIFQQYALFPWRTALSNVEFGLESKNIPRRKRAEIALRYLALVNLTGFEDRYPHELSGGMKQRVAIARSLAYDPDILLMDEPFAALDAQTRESLQLELLRIWRETKKTVVFVTHSIEEAVFLGRKVIIMSARPGVIKFLLDINLADAGDDSQDIRYSPEFANYRQQIWALLKAESLKAENSYRELSGTNVK